MSHVQNQLFNTSTNQRHNKYSVAMVRVPTNHSFGLVALAPFLTITSILVVLLFAVNPEWLLTIIGILFAHTAMCSGDFGLLSYFEFHKDKQVVTYDDTTKQVSYFYVLTQEN